MSAMVTVALAVVGGEDGMEIRHLVDFADRSPAWSAIDDRVMGGVSASSMKVEDGVGVFSGRLSTDRGGGFASVRTAPGRYDLTGCDALLLRVRGDGRRYRLRVRTSASFDGVSYQAVFPTAAGQWTEVQLPLDDLEPVFRGRPVPGAPGLDPAGVRTLGLMVADGQVGDFRLEVAAIDAVCPRDAE